jgi:TPR repeat protein
MQKSGQQPGPSAGRLSSSSSGPTTTKGRACAVLGQAHEEGKGTKKDMALAQQHYTTSCETSFPVGCVMLGTPLLEGGPRDAVAASDAYKKACDIDARKGCFELAQLHAGGKWPGADDKLASEFYQKTCNIDPTRGCFEAGQLMEAGRVEASEGSIEYLYHLACDHGHTEACSRRNVEMDKIKAKAKK